MTNIHERPAPPVPGPGGGMEQKPGLFSTRQTNHPKKAGRSIRRVLASPCDRPPATPTGVKMVFRVREAKNELEFSGRIVWDDVTTDTSGFDINTVDRWDVRWRATDLDGDPIPVEHCGLERAWCIGDTYWFQTARAINTPDDPGFDWHTGDRVKVSGCYPETNYNGIWTIEDIPTGNQFTVTKGTTPNTPEAKRVGNVYNQSTDRHYEHQERNPQPRIALRKAEQIVVVSDHKSIQTMTNPSGSTWRINVQGQHTYKVGDYVKVENESPNAYNGVWKVINIIDTSHFEVQGNRTSVADGSTGDVYFALAGYRYTTRGDSGFNKGEKVTIKGNAPEAEFNGTWPIEAVDPSAQTFDVLPSKKPDDMVQNAETVGVAIDTNDSLSVAIKHVPRPRTWKWQAQVRCRSGEGCWSAFSDWTTPKLPWNQSNPKPPVPDYGAFPITFDHKGKGRHSKIRLLFTFDEVLNWDVPGGDHEDDMAGYDVRLDTSEDQGLNWEGTIATKHISAKQDTDNDTTVTAEFFNIHRHRRYRCSVRSRDRFGRHGNWSAWTNGALPFDDVAPPFPLNVQHFARHDQISIEWNYPVVLIGTQGTVTAAAGGNTVLGAGTKFGKEVQAGDLIQVGSERQFVKRIQGPNGFVIAPSVRFNTTGVWAVAHTGETVYLVEDNPDISLYEAQIANAADVDFLTSPWSFNDIFARWRGNANHHTFRIPDSDEEDQWYLRARAIDAARNRSEWVYATVAGNSAPAANGDPIQIVRDVLQVTFDQLGAASVDDMVGMWRADKDYRIVRARLTAGNHDGAKHPDDGTPSGRPLMAQLHKIINLGTPSEQSINLVDNVDKLSIPGAHHADEVNPKAVDFHFTDVDEGDYLQAEVTQTGNPSGRTGHNPRMTVTLVPRKFELPSASSVFNSASLDYFVTMLPNVTTQKNSTGSTPKAVPAAASFTPLVKGRANKKEVLASTLAPVLTPIKVPQLLFRNIFEGGSDGTTITGGNSGGASGDAFSNASSGGANSTLKYATAAAFAGSLGMKTQTTSTSEAVFVRWDLTQTKLWLRAYLQIPTTLPTATCPLIRFATSANNTIAALQTTTNAGEVRVNRENGTNMGPWSSVLSTGTWYRVEMFCDVVSTSANIIIRIYPGTSITPSVLDQSDSFTFTSTQIDRVFFGIGNANANYPLMYWDRLALSNHDWVGIAA